MVSTGRVLTQVATWSLMPVLLVATFVVEARGPATSGPGVGELPLIVAILASWLVGVVLSARSYAHPAGWAFLGLGTALAWSAFTDEYAPHGDGDPLPGYDLVATLGDTSFVWWFVFIALVLQFTPPEPREGRLARRLPLVTVLSGVAFQVLALLRSSRLDPPHDDIVSPWAVAALRGPAAAGAAIAVFLLAATLLVSAIRLLGSWRRSTGEARRRLLWLVAGAIPVPPVVVAAFALSWAGRNALAAALIGLAIVCLVIGAALSVLRYRLYDVERVVTVSAAYAIASVTVAVTFVGVILVISTSTPIEARSQLPAVAATLAGVVTARVAYVWGRRAVGRRVNQTRFEAVESLRSGLSDPSADLDALVGAALGGRARVVYPADGGTWVTAQGHEVVTGTAHVDVRRRGVLTARVEYDPEHNDREVVEAVAAAAAPEIDNVALRAELARQLEAVTESRSRLATAHLEERHRMERDLHDGAQQRLLAIAMQLQAARLNGGPEVLTREVDRAVAGLAETVQELRDLAGGLQPAALAGGGLLAAVVDLAGRAPLRVRFDVVDRRFPAPVEAAAWFVIAEAMTNVVKHARTDHASIVLTATESVLRVVVADCGVGGADEHGHGLAGLADRVAALRGTLVVRELEPHGTEIEAVLPCAS